MYICPLLYAILEARNEATWSDDQVAFDAKTPPGITKRAQQPLSNLNEPIKGFVAIYQWPTMVDIFPHSPLKYIYRTTKQKLYKLLAMPRNKAGLWCVYLQNFYYSLVTASSRQGTASMQTPRKAYDLGIYLASRQLRINGLLSSKPPCRRRCTHGYQWEC